jgi:hypothetical protein
VLVVALIRNDEGEVQHRAVSQGVIHDPQRFVWICLPSLDLGFNDGTRRINADQQAYLTHDTCREDKRMASPPRVASYLLRRLNEHCLGPEDQNIGDVAPKGPNHRPVPHPV